MVQINRPENLFLFAQKNYSLVENHYKNVKHEYYAQNFKASLCIVGALALVAAAITALSLFCHLPPALHFLNCLSIMGISGPIGFGASGIALLISALVLHKTYCKKMQGPKLEAFVFFKDEFQQAYLGARGMLDGDEVLIFKNYSSSHVTSYVIGQNNYKPSSLLVIKYGVGQAPQYMTRKEVKKMIKEEKLKPVSTQFLKKRGGFGYPDKKARKDAKQECLRIKAELEAEFATHEASSPP